jgi:hypothetical protein
MGDFKEIGASAEFVPEFAKELTWHERQDCLACQPFVLGEQYYRIYKMLGKVDFIVTDSPIILSGIYDEKHTKEAAAYAAAYYKDLPNVNYFIKRKKKYNPEGRNQTEQQAVAIDEKVRKLLNHFKIDYQEVFSTRTTSKEIILGLLHGK